MTAPGRRASPVRRWWAPALLLGLPMLIAVAGPWFAPHDPLTTSTRVLSGPSAEFPLGTDHLGRDVLSRLLCGGRELVGVALASLAVAELIGITLGLVAGYSRRIVRGAVLGATEIMLAVPSLLLLSALVAGFGRSWTLLLAASAAVMVPTLVPLVATRTTMLAGQPWMRAALLAGESRGTVLVRELLPNLRPVVAADAGIRLLTAIFMVSTAGFLGFGPEPPAPDWGLMIHEARDTMSRQPWPVAAPAMVIACFALGANLVARRFAETAVAGVAAPPSPARDSAKTARPMAAEPADAPEAPADTLVAVRRLTIADTAGHPVLAGFSLTVADGEAVAVTGPSGAGKSTLGLALLGHLRPGLTVAAGRVTVTGVDVLTAEAADLRALRRHTVRHVPQDPAAALTPTMRVGTLLAEASAEVPGTDAAALLALVRLPSDRAFLRRRPHALSGGQRRRLALAMALAGAPRLVVLDEPTNGLDTATRDEVVAELGRLRARTGAAFVVITHDPVVAARLCDREVVVDRPHTPAKPTPVTRAAAPVPDNRPTNADAASEPLLHVRDLTAGHGSAPVLRGVSLTLRAGECVAVLGASGAGKTTLAHCLAGLHPRESGTVLLGPEPLAPAARDRPAATRRRLALVFQDPFTSLNPAHRVDRLIGRPAALRGDEPEERVARLLAEVGLPEGHGTRYPAQLSGGERQRVAIARALAARPDVLLCDEVTAALDPDNAAAVRELLDHVRVRHQVAVLLVSHDLDTVRHLARHVVVLHDGRVVEEGRTREVLDTPAHPVTRRLVGAPGYGARGPHPPGGSHPAASRQV